jgi:two-component system response regulator FixJ
MNTLQVYVVDDDEDVRKGLLALLASADYPAQAFESADSFLDALVTLPQPLGGCLIADMRMPGQDGLTLQRRLFETGHRLPIIFLTGYGELPDAVQAMRAGALDFLLKPVDGSRLIERIGEIWQSETERVRCAARQLELRRTMSRLTVRERQVLAAALDGMPNREIAAFLHLSERTVEAHRSRLLLKLDAQSLQAWLQQCEKAGLSRTTLLTEIRAASGAITDKVSAPKRTH